MRLLGFNFLNNNNRRCPTKDGPPIGEMTDPGLVGPILTKICNDDRVQPRDHRYQLITHLLLAICSGKPIHTMCKTNRGSHPKRRERGKVTVNVCHRGNPARETGQIKVREKATWVGTGKVTLHGTNTVTDPTARDLEVGTLT